MCVCVCVCVCVCLHQARLEVHRFGITGYKKEQQRVFEQDRAIMLGARVRKKSLHIKFNICIPAVLIAWRSTRDLIIVCPSASQEGLCQLQGAAAANQREEAESKGGGSAGEKCTFRQTQSSSHPSVLLLTLCVLLCRT